MARTRLSSLALGLLLVAGCSKDSGKEKAEATGAEKTAPGKAQAAIGIPAKLAGQYELATASTAQPLGAEIFVYVTPEELSAGKVPEGALPAGGKLPAAPAELATLDGIVAELVGGPATAREATGSAADNPDEIDAALVGDSAASLIGPSDISSGLDDPAVFGGLFDKGPVAHGISARAPVLLADRNMKATRLIEVMQALCNHGARVGVARGGSEDAGEHRVKLGILQDPRCFPVFDHEQAVKRPDGDRARVIMGMLDSGYEVRTDEKQQHVEKGNSAALGAMLTRLRMEGGIPLELWVLVGEQALVQELVAVLDAAAVAEVKAVYVAALDVLADEKSDSAAKSDATSGIGDEALARWLEGSGATASRDLGEASVGAGSGKTAAKRHGERRRAPDADSVDLDMSGGFIKGVPKSSSSGPRLQLGNASSQGGLDKNIVRRYIRRKLPRIKYCYEKRLMVEPTLKGVVRATFEIAPSGTVIASSAEGVHEEVSNCVAEVIRSIQFPAPSGGGRVKVTYPFKFEPGGK